MKNQQYYVAYYEHNSIHNHFKMQSKQLFTNKSITKNNDKDTNTKLKHPENLKNKNAQEPPCGDKLKTQTFYMYSSLNVFPSTINHSTEL